MNDRHVISPYPIRMPQELRDRLEKSAKDGSRSLHAEIIGRLQASYIHIPRSVTMSAESASDQMNELFHRDSMINALKSSKMASIHSLTVAAKNATSDGEREALNAAIKAAFAEVEELRDQSRNALKEVQEILNQARLNHMARDGEDPA